MTLDYDCPSKLSSHLGDTAPVPDLLQQIQSSFWWVFWVGGNTFIVVLINGFKKITFTASSPKTYWELECEDKLSPKYDRGKMRGWDKEENQDMSCNRGLVCPVQWSFSAIFCSIICRQHLPLIHQSFHCKPLNKTYFSVVWDFI